MMNVRQLQVERRLFDWLPRQKKQPERNSAYIIDFDMYWPSISNILQCYSL